MKRHERDIIQHKAEAEIHLAISDLVDKHDLTDIETLQILQSYQSSTLKYMLRYERHGDYQTPAGLEK